MRENGDGMSKHQTHDGSKLTPAQIGRLDQIEASMGDDDTFPPCARG